MYKPLSRLTFSISFLPACLFSIIVVINLFVNNIAYAQFSSGGGNGNGSYTATSNCVITVVGNPPANLQLPPQCASGGNGSVVWPYPVKTPSQNRRVDQGWDLEYTAMGNPVRAVVSGTINYNHGPNPCNGGSGFGDTYPLEVLDSPVVVNGRKYTEIYYGHVNGDKSLNGKRVKAGDTIATTYDCVNLGAGFIPWLEIGFWGSGGPVGLSYSLCSLDNAGDTSKNTQAGCDMKQWLNRNTK